MKVLSSSRGLVENIGVKLIALVVAMMIWFNASGQQEQKKNIVASLQFVNVPDSLTITGQPPSEVQLSITGTRRELLFMGFKRLEMRINLAQATPGRFKQRLAVSNLLLPPGVQQRDVRIISPLSVDVSLDRLITKRLGVAVMLSGALPANQLLNRVPVAQPAYVLVTGPENAVAPLEKLPTKPIDLTRIRESVIVGLPWGWLSERRANGNYGLGGWQVTPRSGVSTKRF